jgi:DNA polymerase III delta subunit
MYLVFTGGDRLKIRDSVTKYIEKNMPAGATLSTIDEGVFEAGQVTNALGANSLFGGEEWFVFDNPSENNDFNEEIKKNLKELSESSNTFLILEGALLAPEKKSYAKYATEVVEIKAEKKNRFNAFVLADALANRDKKKLWVLLQEAKLEGIRDEEIVGILWWQLKSLRLASLTNQASEAGMSDFPYSKAKRALTKFKAEEVNKLSQQLLELYHDGHAGVRDMDNSLEQWILKAV